MPSGFRGLARALLVWGVEGELDLEVSIEEEDESGLVIGFSALLQHSLL